MSSWAWWGIAAVALFIGEVLTLDLTLAMVGAGALAGAAAAAAGAPLAGQIIVAAVVAALMLVAVRPVVRRHLVTPRAIRTGVAALVGERGRALSPIDADAGRAKIGGEVWSARSFDGSPIAADDMVEVVRIDGATAIVLSIEERE